jgi:carotenoid cleavage dioxygenase
MADLGGEPAKLWRWTIDCETGKVTDDLVDENYADFPKVDDRLVGLESRYGFAASFEKGEAPILGKNVIKYDLEKGTTEFHNLGDTCSGQEPVFVPSSVDADEGDGFVLALSYDAETDSSDLVIIDAQDFEGPPLGRVKLPQRVPYGAHGNWIPSD